MKYLLILFGLYCSVGGWASAPIDVPELMKSAHFGALVMDLEQGDVLLAHNAAASFAPASLTKLVTTATAMQMLSPRYVYTTTLSYTGEIKEDVITGSLLVKGSGDPTLGSEYVTDVPLGFLYSWVNHLKKNEIHSIAGDLIVDASVFDSKVLGDKWIWEDVGNYYGAGVYGVSFLDNRYQLTLRSGAVGAPVQVIDVQPQDLAIDFNCTVLGADNTRDNAYIYGSPWTFERRVRGTIPEHRDRFVIKGAMPNPPLVFGRVFARVLAEAGIELQGEVKVDWQGADGAATLLSSWVSPSLFEIISITNKQSNNLFAEHLLKSLSIGEGPASVDASIEGLMRYWQGQGLSCDGVKLYDGSGLSRANLLSPEFIVGVLNVMHGSAYAEAFKSSLAVAGTDGTFKYFLDNTPLAQKVIGKSGGMSGVRCYAGYTHWNSKEYAFCVMVNNSTASMAEMKLAIEEYLLQVWR